MLFRTVEIARSEAGAAERVDCALHSRHIPKLDALRAISALLVMLYHFGYPLPAGFGVECFFVISGFLITWLLLAERDKTGANSLKNFYVRRAFRIFPAFYFYWGLLMVQKLIRHRPILWGQAIASFFYVGNYYQGLNHYPEWSFSRAWSLGVEEQFYLLWPFLFARFGGRRQQLLKFLACTIVAIWVYRLVLFFAGVPEYYLYTAFETRADAIFVGCALSIALRERLIDGLIEKLCQSWKRLLPTLALLVFSMVLQRYYGVNYRDPIAHIVEPVLFAVLIVQLIGIQWRPLAMLDTRPVKFLGSISYSTYLYHGLITLPGNLPVIFLMIPSYAVATASYLGVEKPFLLLRDKWFALQKKRLVPTSPK